MKLAWTPKTTDHPLHEEQAHGTLPSFSAASFKTLSDSDSALKKREAVAGLSQVFRGLLDRFKIVFANRDTPVLEQQPFLTAQQKNLSGQIENLAESPFEKTLFGLKKTINDYTVSKVWAEGIRSRDPLIRESALTLFRATLTYSGIDTSYELSPHTQMKLLVFAPFLNEGILGKAVLYEALLHLPIPQMMGFSAVLQKEFSQLPSMAQAFLIRQMIQQWKNSDKSLEDEDKTALKHLLKTMIIEFYCTKPSSHSTVLSRQEKIRLGFLKIQPVEEDFQRQLEEVERRYRLKLRQLKKRRTQMLAEVEEEKSRRIEMVYESIESHLIAGLSDLDLSLADLLAG
jgi:hypothetical protein